MYAGPVVGVLVVIGLVAAVGLGLVLGRSEQPRPVGVFLGPLIGLVVIGLAQELSNEGLNGAGGDITARSLTTFAGIALIPLYLGPTRSAWLRGGPGLSGTETAAPGTDVSATARGGMMRAMPTEIRDVAAGLWIWRTQHPDWAPDVDWEPGVTSVCVESGGEVLVLDALIPEAGADEVLARLDALRPTVAVVLKPDHVRSVDAVVERYGARAFGPSLFWRDDIPQTELEPIEPGSELPGGLVALYDGRGRNETPLWLPEQRALAFADALTERDGRLRVWGTPWHAERVVPALTAMLELPFEHVIVSHGEPLHDRAAFERALELPPWDD